MSKLRFGRTIAAMVTPFTPQGDVDLYRAQELAVRLSDGGCDAIAICATTGEGPTIFYPQKLDLISAVVSAVPDSCKVIANVGTNSTADSISFAQDVAPLGVDGFMTVVPYYNKPPQEGLYQHFRAIAQSVELPVILYNIPGRSVINLEAKTTIALARDVENILGIKEASSNMEQIQEIIDNVDDEFAVYSGEDQDTVEIMKRGGCGVISTIANIAPGKMSEITSLCAEGKFDIAYDKSNELLPLMNELFVTTNPIMVKEALKILDFEVGGLHLPLIEATQQQHDELLKVMKQVGDIY